MSACSNCGATGVRRLFLAPAFDTGGACDEREFDITRCEKCGIVSTLGVTEAILEKAYRGDYYGAEEQKFTTSGEWLVAAAARHRAGRLERAWRRQMSSYDPPAVLDVGCGRGLLLRAFLARGCRVQGLERGHFPLPDALREKIHRGKLEELGQEQFDLVVLWHVLEHLQSPDGFLAEITAYMREGACIAIAVPNFASWQRRMFGACWFHLDLPRHLVHLEPDWLRERLEQRGFVVESESYWEPVQSLYGFIQSMLNRLFPRQRNRLYQLLKVGRHGPAGWLALGIWAVAGTVILPVALVETIAGGVFANGATVRFVARWQGDK